MGSYGFFRVDGYELFSSRNDVSPDVLVVYRETDKRITTYPVPPDANPEDHPPHSLCYVAQVEVVRERLELFDFSLAYSKRLYDEAREVELEELRRRESDPTWARPEFESALRQEREALEALTFDVWCAEFSDTFRDRRPRLSLYTDEWEGTTPVQRRVRSWDLESFFGFPGYDARPFIRVVAECVPPTVSFEYDLTDLLGGGYLELEEDLTTWSLHEVSENEYFGNGIIVLTEGKTDQRILERTLALLSPHLASYFKFVDFDLHRVEGGAGRLVHTLKVLSGAGIANRIVALFDNDTAAASALRSLDQVRIPRNVRVLQFPKLDIAGNYPTLGPHGLVGADVNGLAGGLELYFGRDVLTGPGGALTPVQWRGFDDRLGRYQGELLREGDLQRAYMDKLTECERDPARIPLYDWSGMRKIIDALIRAFHGEL